VGDRDLAADVKPEPEPADPFDRRQPLEGLEDPAVIGAGNAHPLVPDPEAQAIRGGLGRQQDRSAHPVFDRVRDEVGHQLFQSAAVPGPGDGGDASELDRGADLRRLLRFVAR